MIQISRIIRENENILFYNADNALNIAFVLIKQ